MLARLWELAEAPAGLQTCLGESPQRAGRGLFEVIALARFDPPLRFQRSPFSLNRDTATSATSVYCGRLPNLLGAGNVFP